MIDISSFVGRRRELRQLVKLQATSRLLTLVGPGGSGKSRLAANVAQKRRRALSDNVWFVDMIRPVRYGELSVSTHEPALLVLDTCDVDIAHSARLVERLLSAYERLQIIATSREPLGIDAELVWRVPMLSLAAEQGSGVRQLRASEASQLFIERAGAGLVDESGASERGEAIARICRTVDGLPLAIEIVALQARDIGLKVLAERTTTPLILGFSGARDAPARHRSLRSNLDWSYSRLSATEQQVLRRVSVFGSSWSVEKARIVCPDRSLEQFAEAVRSLKRKSLVYPVRRAHGRQFELSEITRQYGTELLNSCGEREQVRRRHIEWCVALAEAEPPEAVDSAHANRLEIELPEMRLALDWAAQTGVTGLGLRLATAAFPLWYLRGRCAEGLSWLERLLTEPHGAAGAEMERARAWRSQLQLQMGDFVGAEAELDSVLSAQRARSDEQALGLSQVLLANVALWRGDLERAARLYRDAELVLRDRASPAWPMTVFQLARVAWELGDVALARAEAGRVAQINRAPRAFGVARAHQIEALAAADAGDFSLASNLLDDTERAFRRINDAYGFVDLLIDRGRVLQAGGQQSAAHQAYVNAASLASSIGARVRLTRAIEGVACALVETQPSLSVQLAAAASATRREMQCIAWPRDAKQLSAALAIAHRYSGNWPDAASTGVGSATFAQVWQTGSVMLDSDAVALTLGTLSARPAKVIADIPASLTVREWEVARLFAGGASARQIAERLTLSRDTVRTHLDRASAKLGLHSRVQLAMWVARSQAEPV